MDRRMKKLLSLVLAAAMLLSLAPAAFAEEAEAKTLTGKEYGVDYIYISGHERANFSADEAWFLQNCYLIYDEGGVRIFALDEEDALRALGDAELTVADSLAD